MFVAIRIARIALRQECDVCDKRRKRERAPLQSNRSSRILEPGYFNS